MSALKQPDVLSRRRMGSWHDNGIGCRQDWKICMNGQGELQEFRCT